MEQVVASVANSFGEFCSVFCKAKCCKTGSLILESKKDISLFNNSSALSFIRADGFVEVSLFDGCVFLDGDFHCSIHLDRPVVCRSFPLFLRGKKVFVASWCPAVMQGILNDKLAELEALGLEIILQ